MSIEDSQPTGRPDVSGEPVTDQPAGEPAGAEVPEITDPKLFRALSHPVRIALVEELTLHGPMTATEVGDRIGESPTTCSFHLRQLAKYGFVEEAGGGKGRARPWRITAYGMHIPGVLEDPEAQVAFDLLHGMFRQRHLARYQRWQDTKASFPQDWRRAATDSEYILYLTADELDQISEEVHEILIRKFDRLADPSKRPPGSLPVELLLFSYPMELPGTEQAGEQR
ncbi:MAG TPA: helix-turn-helix domain-containing protein [Streptosporangiaceae bacterium]|jgi:DNA-binding transcriptional ArsR family regulator